MPPTKPVINRLQTSAEEHSRTYIGQEHKELVKLVPKPSQDVKGIDLV